MTTSPSRLLLSAGALLLAAAALAAPALCQERAAARTTLAVTQAERPLPVRIDPAGRYLIVAPGTVGNAPDPGEAQRIHDALDRQGFRIVHERRATPQSMAASVKRLVDNGVRAENISVLAMGEDVQALIDVAQRVYSPMVNYVIIAGCETMPSFASRVPLKGRILSLQMEKPDAAVPSCRGVFAGRGAASGFQFEEYVIRHYADSPASAELALVEAINAWTRAGYDDEDDVY